MSDAKPKILNFPDRQPKVVLGEHINATTARALTRMTIGTYEMSVAQVEQAKYSAAAAKAAITALAKERGLAAEPEKSRDHVCIWHAKSPETQITVWVTTPLEPTQSAHLVWARIATAGAEPTIGIAYKLANEFSPEQVLTVIKNAEKNARALPAGEAYVLKGNPPPRFLKKGTAPTADAPAADAAAE